MEEHNKISGNHAENRFIDAVYYNYNKQLYKSSIEEDRYKHYDLYYCDGDKRITFDVKAFSLFTANWHKMTVCSFYKGTRNIGYIFADSLDFIAYEREEYFLIVSREKLYNFLSRVYKIENILHNSKK